MSTCPRFLTSACIVEIRLLFSRAHSMSDLLYCPFLWNTRIIDSGFPFLLELQGGKESIPLLVEEVALSPSPALTSEDRDNGNMQTSVNKKEPWGSISIYPPPNGAQCDSVQSSFPVKPWHLHPTQSGSEHLLPVSVPEWLLAWVLNTLQAISQFYKHLCHLTSCTSFAYLINTGKIILIIFPWIALFSDSLMLRYLGASCIQVASVAIAHLRQRRQREELRCLEWIQGVVSAFN